MRTPGGTFWRSQRPRRIDALAHGRRRSNEGVQWNAGYYPRDGAVWLGVNLEGMKYDDWPVARLIEREISRPLILTCYRRKVARPDRVTVIWARDAWQCAARRRIKEADLVRRATC